MQYVEWSPRETEDRALVSDLLVPKLPEYGWGHVDHSSFGATALASFERENVVANLIYNNIGTRFGVSEDGYSTSTPSDWNPYRTIRDTWSEDRRKSLDLYVRKGLFENVSTPAQLEIKARLLEEELRRNTILAQGGGFASFLGGLSGAIVDPVNLLPFGAAFSSVRNAGRIGKFLIGATTGAAGVATSEALLHQFQDTRTLEESALNIVTGAALGGAIGSLTRLHSPLSEMHPDHPAFPFSERNLQERSQAIEVPGSEGERLSLSAAAMPSEAPKAASGLTSRIPGLSAVTSWIDRRTPVGRALTWTGEKSRTYLSRFLDLGGRYTNGVQRATWEDLKRDFLITHRDTLFLKGDAIWSTVNRTLAESGTKSISQPQFEEIARRHLLGTWGEADKKVLSEQFGDTGAAAVEAEASRYAELIHENNAAVEQRLMDIGKVRNDAIVTKLAKEVRDLKARVAAVARPFDTRIADSERNIADIRENRSALGRDEAAARRKVHEQSRKDQIAQRDAAVAAERAAIAEELADRQKLLASEMAKPAAMGRNYGHAQLWDRPNVLAKQEEFEQFLRSVLINSPDEGWLRDAYALSPDEFSRLGKEPIEIVAGNPVDGEVARIISPEEGQALKNRVLAEWAGDEHSFRVAQAELRAAAAEAALKQSTLDLTDISRAYGFVSREHGAVNLKEATALRNKYYAKLAARRAHTEQLRALRDTLARAMQAGAENETARASQLIDRLPDAGETELSAVFDAARRENAARNADDKATLEAFRLLPDAMRDPASAGRIENSGDVGPALSRLEKTGEGLSEATARSEKAADAAFVNPIEAAKAPEMVKTIRTEVAAEKLRSANRRLERADTLVRQTEERLAHWDAAHAEASAKRDALASAKEAIREARVAASAEVRAAERDAGKAGRTLRSVQKDTPLDQAIADIRQKLISHNELPRAIMDQIAVETVRAKARRLLLTPDQRKVAEGLGFLRTDLRAILESQHEQLSGYVAGNEIMRDLGFAGGLEDWSKLHREVSDEYDRLRQRSPENSANLVAEQDKLVRDLNLIKDRLLGTENVGADKGGWAYWLAKKVREANFIRTGIDFGMNSFNDIASVYLREGSLATLLREHAPRAIKEMKRTRMEDPAGFSALLRATEIGMQGARMARALDIDDAVSHSGIGAKGTLKHTITSKMDNAAEWLARKTNTFSGQTAWNRFWKITSGISRSYRLRDMAANFDGLSAFEKADLETLGIGRAEAKRMHEMITKHGTTDADGNWDPNIDAWMSSKGGREAARDFRIAIERDMNRSVATPGVGDTPALMSHAVGRLWLQFQTFAFTFMNRVLIPSSQRIATYRDAQALVAFAHLMWSSSLVIAARDLMKGEDPSKRFEATSDWVRTAYDIVDRSGLTGFMSPYADSVLKLTSPAQSAIFGASLRPSKFSSNEWFTGLAGPAMGFANDFQKFGASVGAGDGGKSMERGLRLLPWNDLSRLVLTLDAALLDN